jgi:hypothetical protein
MISSATIYIADKKKLSVAKHPPDAAATNHAKFVKRF